MKYIKFIFIIFLAISCKKNNEKHIAIGTWNKCSNDGNYFEYIITEKYVIMLTTNSDEVLLYKNQVLDSILIFSEFKNGNGLITNNDKLITILKSDDKIVLRSAYTLDTIELNKVEFDFDEIDSTNLAFWKNKTLSQFKKRASLEGCQDLRTEDEKTIPFINMNEIELEEIPIIEN